ncbi:hypothetical protein GCM10027275_17990 [Rhabdobacter roseus]|uniref:Uncharacterized protein n=1 Tax=Rhabdobacter roseus TaxID=1655419 RepID=A0A840TUR8_9BACT|nr:hypothetical protein [Rhabdobacter roseus]MBB5283720.1 hypothetical protein [Rhabdobacter roseus]
MATMIHLKGQNYAFNIERVDYFIRSEEQVSEEENAPLKYLITFYSNAEKVGIWEYDLEGTRDAHFVELIQTTYDPRNQEGLSGEHLSEMLH